MRRSWPAAALLYLFCGACSYTFDDEAPEVPLLGEAPETGTLPQLNRVPVEGARVLRGTDGASWLAIREMGGVARLLRLSEPGTEVEFAARQVQLLSRAVYLIDPSTDPDRPGQLRIVRPGVEAAPEEFALPSGEVQLFITGDGEGFASFVRAKETKRFDLVRTSGFRRTLPLPKGLDAQNPQGEGLFFFDGLGRLFFVRDGTGRLWAHATLQEADADLGLRPRSLILLDSQRAILACGEDGLVLVPWDGSAARALDPRPCSPDGLRVVDRAVFYLSQAALYRVPLDGSGAPERAFLAPAQQLLSAGPGGLLAYSIDAPRRWASGASDGWIDDWRFMDRGRLPAFGDGGRRVRWLERAATLSGAGDLVSAELFSPPLRLARNVRQFAELPDGRVLCVANYAFRGAQNRIVVIDERARTARWVSAGTNGYLSVPGTGDLLVQLVRDNRGFDLVRVPIP